MADWNREFLQEGLRALSPELELTLLAETDSTNEVAKAIGLQSPQGIVLADHQIRGKGRRGRSFHSPQGSGIYLSIYFHRNFSPDEAILLPFICGVASAVALRQNGFPVQLKWINDLLLLDENAKRELKVGGILCESRLVPDSPLWVCGIGINVRRPANGFPEELQTIATSLLPATDAHLPQNLRESLVLGITEELLKRLYNGKTDLNEYKELCLSLGRRIDILEADGSITPALAEDILPDGKLQVRTESGRVRLLDTEEIHIVHRTRKE